jgi:glycosyltransferase involved in cell wall biosynthesis
MDTYNGKLEMQSSEIVYINGKFLSQPVTGVQRFALEILKVLNELGIDFIVLMPVGALIPDWLEAPKFEFISKFQGVFWEQISLPVFLKKKTGNKVLLNLCNTAPLFYSNNIITVHDVAFHRNPAWFSKSFAFFYNQLIPRIIKNAVHVFTVSEFVKLELVELYKVKSSSVSVIYNAASNEFIDKQYINRESFCLVVGSIEPRKNLELVFQYFADRPNERLVVVGKKAKIFNALDFNESQLENVLFTGFIPDEELVDLYNRSKLFIFPSIYEGFGIPPIEAQICGCPVIASNQSAMPEVLLDSAVYFDPFNKNDFFAKMDEIMIDEDMLNTLVAKGKENSSRFSWVDSGKKILRKMEQYL